MKKELDLYIIVRFIRRLVLLLCAALSIGLMMVLVGNTTFDTYTKMFMNVSPCYLVLVICEATELILKLFTKR